MPSGIIIKGIGGFYYVKTPERIYECKARGVFRKEELTPLPGDRVTLTAIDEKKGTGSIDAILPRDSVLIRPAVANINQVAVVLAVRSPNPDFILLDKLLITADRKHMGVVICINKIDLDEDNESEKIIRAYEKAGYEVIKLSSKQEHGFDRMKEVLCGKITVFAGQSGVGKSTILNRVMKSWVMETGDVSHKIERGKHTTRHAELLALECGGYVADTPGFSSFELAEITHDFLELYYPEFAEYLNSCRFTGCSHISEPGCSIKAALEKGLIDQGRYQRYIQFYNTLKENRTYKSAKNSLK